MKSIFPLFLLYFGLFTITSKINQYKPSAEAAAWFQEVNFAKVSPVVPPDDDDDNDPFASNGRNYYMPKHVDTTEDQWYNCNGWIGPSKQPTQEKKLYNPDKDEMLIIKALPK